MKERKIKKVKSKQVNQGEIICYKNYLIYNEFEKIIDNELFFDLDEGLYEFIKMYFSCEIIADFSKYGNNIFELDYTDYISGNKCFLCYIKFEMDDFLDCMYYLYEDVLGD